MREKSFRGIVSESVEGKICTSRFFNESKIPPKYEIAELSQNLFAIIQLGKINVVLKRFTAFCNVKDNVYLLKLEDGFKCLLGITDDKKIVFSDKFSIVVKILKEYTLVENADNSRVLIDDVYALGNGRLRTIDWYSHFGNKYEVFDLPNGEQVVITKEGLKITEGEYFAVNKCLGHRNINNKFVIARRAKDGKCLVIRLSDLKESGVFSLIKTLETYDGVLHTEYVQVHLSDSYKVALMRIKDFELTKGYDKIDLLSPDYARVKDGKDEKLVKLDDFSIAKWVKDE